MFKKKDFILIIAVLVIVGVMLLFMQLGNKAGETVIIKIDGEKYGEYPVNKNTIIDIENETGSNKLVIENGKVYMKSADCPDKYCVEHKPIENMNETIVCLPHKLVVEITSDNGTLEFDAIVQ